MSILSNHSPEVIDAVNQPTAEDWADYEQHTTPQPNLTGLKGLLAQLRGLEADAQRSQHQTARGPATRHCNRGLAIAYHNAAHWLQQQLQLLEHPGEDLDRILEARQQALEGPAPF